MADYPLVLTPFLPAPIFTWDRDEQGAEGVREVLGSALYSYAMNFMVCPRPSCPRMRTTPSRSASRSSAVASART